ncbi:helix-turn-helix domain-containing protein [Ulvibacterium sp.]|uniref:helix-turn-helix domain-containing protein n=1 Tax=Ulvibacterium sp. TaxID=2665914 RepID=UPI003BA93D83
MKIKKYNFARRKYGREFLLDCVFFSEVERKVSIGLPFCYDFHGIFIQNAGGAKIAIDNDAFLAGKGSFIFLRANQVREWISVTPDFSGYLLIFENEFIETFFNDSLFIHRFQFFQTNQPAVLNCNDWFLLEHTSCCEKIRTELDNLQDDSHHYIRSLLYTILIQINRRYIRKFNLSTELYQDSISLRFRKSLEENIRDKQRVGDYTELLKVSRSQLNKAIKKTSGKSTSIIIRERLLTEVKRDLLYSDKNISEIAYGLGFSDNSNFVRFFKGLTGHTPNDFRCIHAK